MTLSLASTNQTRTGRSDCFQMEQYPDSKTEEDILIIYNKFKKNVKQKFEFLVNLLEAPRIKNVNDDDNSLSMEDIPKLFHLLALFLQWLRHA